VYDERRGYTGRSGIRGEKIRGYKRREAVTREEKRL